MEAEHDYIEINKAGWNKKTEFHLKSDFYDVDSFLKGKNSLNTIELDLLDNVEGQSVLHLQCHFGMDTLSLSRLGARATGVDLSDQAITAARDLAGQIGTDTRFICCDIYELSDHLTETFDIIYTSYGVIGWLPDMQRWGQVIEKFLKPGGKLVFVEFHPLVWMFDDDFQYIKYNYFNDGPIVETYEGTYADRSADMKQTYVMWNHSISEVVNGLVRSGLNIQSLDEYDYSPYNCFNKTVEFEPGKFRIEHLNNYIPMVYAITATKASQ